MNEQDLILKQKIEKREKFDTILAYILLVILSAAIVLVLYLKFIRKEKVDTPNEYVPNYISLAEISNALNSSDLASYYVNNNVSFGSSVSDNSLVINYSKDDNTIDLKALVVGNELEINVNEENASIVTDIYKEIANIICVYYGNDVTICKNTLSNINGESTVDGIRFVGSGDINTKIYINMTKSIDINTEVIYDSVTKTSIDRADYSLRLLDIKIYNISVNRGDGNIIFSGSLQRLTDDRSNISVVVKLYDKDDNLLKESSYSFNENNVLGQNGAFEVSFTFNDSLSLDSVTDYSIEIIK